MDTLPFINLLGVKVTQADENRILEYLSEIIERNDEKVFITTPNPEIIVHAVKHPAFKNILNSAQVALPDGVGVAFAAQFLHKRSINRTAGVDFMLKLSSLLNSKNEELISGQKANGKNAKSLYSIGLFGGQPGVAERTSKCLQKKYSRLVISYASDTWNEIEVGSKSMDILFVALGHPKQEKWIYENIDKIPAKIIMGVGGSFDYISGDVKRAPKFLRTVGLEWLFRLGVQPWRWRRQLALIEFIFFVLREKFQPET
ncbi:MAG: WecB/TagA/CpsF family glycosyltransferase [Candidatus Levybacteria bacterium]|nr:WecB/TagA/CpsF family glycosyltransferase [Candidatus Levybacteria bacterium]